MNQSKTLRQSNLLQRITICAEVHSGKPCVRNLRLLVEDIIGMLASGDYFETILRKNPGLEKDDILASLEYARRMVAHESLEDFSLTPLFE
ncbi:MAG: DUF433 domain-containing protein [Candidatus Sumerlaeota bacterium]